jgi:hypothetical protein
MNNNEERRDARAIVRTYKDDEGKTKNVYQTIGSAWVSPHASTITVQIETMPISKDWNGKIYINAPYEKKSESPTHELNKQIHKDVVLEDIDDKPIDLTEVPF